MYTKIILLKKTSDYYTVSVTNNTKYLMEKHLTIMVSES